MGNNFPISKALTPDWLYEKLPCPFLDIVKKASHLLEMDQRALAWQQELIFVRTSQGHFWTSKSDLRC